MKVKFCVDSGANIHSCRKQIIDTERMFDLTDEEWMELSDDDKYEYVSDWANERLEIYWEEM